MVEAIGFTSGALRAISLIPQIYKNYASGSSDDLSTSTILCMYAALSIGTIYGFVIDHVAVYVSNILNIVLYMALHGVKIRNRQKTRRVEASEFILVPELQNGDHQVCHDSY